MNMQKLMQEAQKMQAQLQRDQKELESTVYEGNSSLVKVKMNGRYEVMDVIIENIEEFSSEDVEMLQDMIMVAMNEVLNKIKKDKEKKMGKYGQGLSGLM